MEMNLAVTMGMTPEEYKRYLILVQDIEPERKRQTEKHGNPSLTPMQWLPILMEEVGELAKEAVDHEFEGKAGPMDDYRKELVQVAAMAFKMLEDFDRQTFIKPVKIFGIAKAEMWEVLLIEMTKAQILDVHCSDSAILDIMLELISETGFTYQTSEIKNPDSIDWYVTLRYQNCTYSVSDEPYGQWIIEPWDLTHQKLQLRCLNESRP